MAREVDNFFPKKFTYYKYKLEDEDTQSIENVFEEINAIIAKHAAANEPVFVHCAAGVSRSATIVMAYIMQTMKKTYKQSFEYVQSRRLVVCPNDGFVTQLRSYEKQLRQQGLLTMPETPNNGQIVFNKSPRPDIKEMKNLKPMPATEELKLQPNADPTIGSSLTSTRSSTSMLLSPPSSSHSIPLPSPCPMVLSTPAHSTARSFSSSYAITTPTSASMLISPANSKSPNSAPAQTTLTTIDETRSPSRPTRRIRTVKAARLSSTPKRNGRQSS